MLRFTHYVSETVSVGSPWYSSIWGRQNVPAATDRTVRADQRGTSQAGVKGGVSAFVTLTLFTVLSVYRDTRLQGRMRVICIHVKRQIFCHQYCMDVCISVYFNFYHFNFQLSATMSHSKLESILEFRKIEFIGMKSKHL